MMNNRGCQGYVMKALKHMIKNKEIDIETARKVMNNVYYEFSLLTEKEAEDYYCNNSIEDYTSK